MQLLGDLRHREPGAAQHADTVGQRLARVGEPLRWSRRAVVSADGAAVFRTDDGSQWLGENNL